MHPVTQEKPHGTLCLSHIRRLFPESLAATRPLVWIYDRSKHAATIKKALECGLQIPVCNDIKGLARRGEKALKDYMFQDNDQATGRYSRLALLRIVLMGPVVLKS